ncbi:MAG: MC/SLC25 family protein [archaeon]|nr:MC/SLC25 family protein [archaeon]
MAEGLVLGGAVEATRNSSSSSSASVAQIGVGLLSGSLAGAANVLIGHPFDTTKVRMQVSGKRLWETVSTLVKQEGVSSLYRGMFQLLFSIRFFDFQC